MAEIQYNDLLSQLSGQEQDQFQGVFGSKGWLGNYQDNPNAPMVTGHSSYDKFKPIADAAAQSKTLNNSFWSNLNPFGTAADAAMPSDAERAAINNSGIMQGYRPNMRDVSPEWINTSGFDLEKMDLNNPDEAIGPIMNFKDAPIEMNEIAKGLYKNNPRYGPIDMWKNQGGDETTRRFPGILGMMQSMFQGAGDKLGMTQVTDADRAANKQFMQDQGIYRDPQTGRMIGGDFAGKNAPGTSGWGSANFDEMRGKWVDKYGEMDYTTKKMKDKRDRLVKEEADYQAKLQADRIEKESKKTITPTTVHHTGDGGAGDRPGGGWYSPPGTPSGEATWKGYLGGRVGYNEGGRVGILSVF